MTQERAAKIFWTVAICYGILCTLLPYLFEPNYRFDIVEMFFVGKEGVVSTFKHPALNSAVLEILYRVLGQSGIAPYLLAQLCFTATAWTVWRLGREFLPQREALFGALAFYGYWAFFYKSMHYNHNVALFPAWGFTILFALFALKRDRTRDWIALGIAIGIGAHIKYTMLVLVAAILLFMALDSRARKRFLRPGPYLTALVALAVALPQIVWIVQSDFSCLKFPELRHGLEKTLANRFYALGNDALFAPCLLGLSFVVLLLPVLGLRLRFRKGDDQQRSTCRFLAAMIVLPWLLSGISCFAGAIPMPYGNFTQLLIPFAPLLLLAFRTRQSERAARAVWILFALTMVGFLAGYSVYVYQAHYLKKKPPLFMFPGRQLAVEAEKIWHDRYEKPLPYVAGGWWYAGNVAIYGKDRPSYHGGNAANAPEENEIPLGNWSTDADVLKHGGLILWLEEQDVPTWPPTIRERFPSAELLPEVISLESSNPRKPEPYRVGVAVVPPDERVRTTPFEPAPWRYY